jgi:hypothetical protein
MCAFIGLPSNRSASNTAISNQCFYCHFYVCCYCIFGGGSTENIGAKNIGAKTNYLLFLTYNGGRKYNGQVSEWVHPVPSLRCIHSAGLRGGSRENIGATTNLVNYLLFLSYTPIITVAENTMVRLSNGISLSLARLQQVIKEEDKNWRQIKTSCGIRCGGSCSMVTAYQLSVTW